MLNMDVISKNLKRLRKEHNFSMEEVAKVIGITRQNYNGYELKTKQITLNAAITLSNLYKVSIDEIVGNPCTVGRAKALDFITYEIADGAIKLTDCVIISTENDTNFIVKDPANNLIYVFGTTVSNIENSIMLFNYQGNIYKSKVMEADNGNYVFFDSKARPVIISKREYNSINYIGALLYEIQPKVDKLNNYI